MNQPFFLVIISILASMFFGVISNWIYEILRKQGVLPEKPNLRKIIIILLVGLAFILLTNLKPAILNNFSDWLLKYSYVPNWLIIIALTITTIIGFWAGQRNTQKLSNTRRSKNRVIGEPKKSKDQQNRPAQGDLEEDIINPR